MTLPPVNLIGLMYGLSEVGLSLLRRSKGSTVSKDGGSLRILWGVILVSVGLGFSLPAFLPHTHAYGLPFSYASGFAVFCLGLALRWYSILYLGRFFTVDVAVAADQSVVDSGPYRLIRHPSYLGSLLAFLGIGICLQHAVSLLVTIVPITGAFLYRIRVEEAALLSTLGEPYQEYCRRTKRLVPFIY